VGNALTFGAGLGYYVDSARTLQVGPELYGQTTVAQGGTAFGKRSTNAELLAGARWRPGNGDWVVGAGIGPGFGRGAGTPDFRAVASVAWSPEREPPPPAADRDGDGVPDSVDACPDVKGESSSDPKMNGCPPDKDKDGIPDDKDACPDVPGVKTDDPKTNGCPPDKDKDGVPDNLDACPDVPGEKTDDPKTNGCPKDTDGDGIIDSQDACPTVKGEKTEDPKTNGCPPDGDKDGVPDAEDACPKVAGPKTSDPKTNGCPTVHVTEEQIVILQQIQFEFAKAAIRPESYGILNDVVTIMKKHPDIDKIEVGGHTDNQGSAFLNRQLSNDRAKAVVKYLVEHGIEAKRLSARGYGPDKPIADNKTEDGRAKNRRVEFKIVKQGESKPAGKPTGGAK
jgi:outer membrane protein OmpA-like peptidoglycan-associated protein